MFVFGHAGLTLGSALLLAGLWRKNSRQKTGGKAGPAAPPASAGSPAPAKRAAADDRGPLLRLAGFVDIRVLLIGALLPDIIDKPIGRFFFQGYFSNGRIYAHTILFFAVLAAGGLLLYAARHRTWLLALAYGTFTHLILDEMWKNTHTLFWPLYGFSFGRHPIAFWSWVERLWNSVSSNPWVLTPEIIGGIIVAWLAWRLVRRRTLLAFLKHGRV
jgi:inner membrane protein